MTRTGDVPRLMSHIAEPFLEIHPEDAARLDLPDAGLAVVDSPHGSAILRVLHSARQRRGCVFAPMHWTDALSARARVNALVPGHVDPVSGQPELKAGAVSVRAFQASWYGFAIARQCPAAGAAAYWARARVTGGWRMELAGSEELADAASFARAVLSIGEGCTIEMLSCDDRVKAQHRFAAFDGDRLVGAVYLSRAPVAVARSWAADQLDGRFGSARERMRLLTARPGATEVDKGAIVCACFEVGANQILASMRTKRCRTVADVGQELRAGTNCGSCRPEIARMLQAHASLEAV
jgi:assimilatory nitrate reductase catalytic subunit